MNHNRYLHWLITCLLLSLALPPSAMAQTSQKTKYPGGKYYIWRYTLKDKQGSPYSIEHPGRFLSHKSIERRKRQGLALDSTDLPVSNRYLRLIEKTSAEVIRESKKRSTEWDIIGTSRWNNTVLMRANDTTLLQRIAALTCMRKAEHVWTSPDSIPRMIRQKAHESFNPWDSLKGEFYGSGKEQIEMLLGQRLHNIGMKGKGMTIAVLDGGFQNADAIPAIQHINIAGTKDFVFPNSPFFFQETDHGTKVLSAMGANEPQVLVGTAPEACYWLLRCEDQQSEQPVEEDYWAAAAEFADSVGVDLINSSLGYQDFDIKEQNHTYAQLDGNTALISRTASLLAQKGIILCNSAGNDGMGQWKKVNFPADARDILAVGAVNVSKLNAVFSSVGPSQDMRVKPDVMALGSPAATIGGNGDISWSMGTSFSSPIMCGMVACLWQALPSLSASEVMNLVRMSADNCQTPNNVFGYGIPDMMKAYEMGKNM